MDITGTTGILGLDMMRQRVEVHTVQSSSYPYMATPLVAEDRSFVDCILNNTPSPVTGEDGLVAVRMVLAALESIKTSRPVKL